jgi:hypothetical protein
VTGPAAPGRGRPPCPYPGPRPFEQNDRERFFGRRDEANEIVSLIIAHQTLLVYAESGTGKTSLFNAAVVPALCARDVDVIGITRVGGDLPPGVNGADVENIYVFLALAGLESASPRPAAAEQPVVPTGLTLAAHLGTRAKRTSDAGLVVPRVLIFDQFEELLRAHPARWKERADFFEQVADALDADASLRVVLVMREEWVAALDPFLPILPKRLRARFRLERLRREAALLAATGPLVGTGYSFKEGAAGVEKGAAELLVENLLRVPGQTAGVVVEGEFIEPLHLQVVCTQLWESLPDPPAEIDAGVVEHYGDVDRALASYYERSIADVVQGPEARRWKISEAELRRWV